MWRKCTSEELWGMCECYVWMNCMSERERYAWWQCQPVNWLFIFSKWRINKYINSCCHSNRYFQSFGGELQHAAWHLSRIRKCYQCGFASEGVLFYFPESKGGLILLDLQHFGMISPLEYHLIVVDLGWIREIIKGKERWASWKRSIGLKVVLIAVSWKLILQDRRQKPSEYLYQTYWSLRADLYLRWFKNVWSISTKVPE